MKVESEENHRSLGADGFKSSEVGRGRIKIVRSIKNG